LLVNGTAGSDRKRSTSALRPCRRSNKLWPTRLGLRPRLPAARVAPLAPAGPHGRPCLR
jgi:hypothetical protein